MNPIKIENFIDLNRMSDLMSLSKEELVDSILDHEHELNRYSKIIWRQSIKINNMECAR